MWSMIRELRRVSVIMRMIVVQAASLTLVIEPRKGYAGKQL